MARKKRINDPVEDFETFFSDDSFLTEDHRYQMRVYELVEKFQYAVPYLQSGSRMRKMVTPCGDAYLFFNKTGELCFLTDFVSDNLAGEEEFSGLVS